MYICIYIDMAPFLNTVWRSMAQMHTIALTYSYREGREFNNMSSPDTRGASEELGLRGLKVQQEQSCSEQARDTNLRN